MTGTGVTLGTVAYMAPEQLSGEIVDARADVWALGVMTYEMLADRPPFEGEHVFAVMQAIMRGTPAPVDRLRPDTPQELARLVTRALQPDRDARSVGASDFSEVATRLRADRVDKPAAPRAAGSRVRLALAGIVALAVTLGAWMWVQRAAKVRWARDTAMPEISRLAGLDDYSAAVDLAREVERYIPGDRQLADVWASITREVSIDSVPPDADVSYRPFGDQARPWRAAGRTPIRGLRLPRLVHHEWKIEKAGFVPI